MPFRILRYQSAILKEYIDKQKEQKQSFLPLPLVVPLVLYNGRVSPYPYTTNITELFTDRELVQKILLVVLN